MTFVRLRRAASVASSALLALSVLGVGGASAADTRSVDFSFGAFSAATVGGRTAVPITLANTGGQTLNHVAFAGGALADGLPYNPLFPKPVFTSLPAGATYAAIFPSTGCSLTGGSANAWASLFCDVGQLAAGASITYLLVINVPATAGSYDTWLTASWNEGWSNSGTNADYTFTPPPRSFDVGADQCGTDASSYFLPGEQVDLDNGGTTCQNQEASILSGSTLTGIGGFASIGIDPTFGAACPAEIHGKCYGVTVEVSVLGGVAVDGGVQWTVKWYGVKSLSGVIHFGDDYAIDPTDYTNIPFTRRFECGGTLTTNCWVNKLSSRGNADPLWFEATFITPDNGRGGGYT